MEYEFLNDPISGSAKAKVSSEHEVFGSWLELEIGRDTNKLTELLTAISHVDSGKEHEITIIGHEYNVNISAEDIVVKNNQLLADNDELQTDAEDAEEFENYDFNSLSACGLEDFRALILSWAKFI